MTNAAKTKRELDQLCVNTIRTLSMDAVQKAESGHPGTPMALAPVVYALWEEFLRFDPAKPDFANRDRFVLSCGHASMLLYSALHLYGYPLALDDLKNFRQLHSPCAGHPEYGHCPGVETTTGPLGAGCSNSVGMALAQKWMAARYNRPGFHVVDYRIFALVSDGDLMEGVAFEAASLAGHWGLDNLVWIFDNNRITIEGSTALAFTEDISARFIALGWQTWHVRDANDLGWLKAAYTSAVASRGGPKLIIVDSQIGYGSPSKAGSHEAHGAPLGAEEVKKTKAAYGWPVDAQFLVPDTVRAHMSGGAAARGKKLRDDWEKMFAIYSEEFPELAAELQAIWKGGLPTDWDKELPVFPADPKGMAGRKASSTAQQAIAKRVPWLIGGSADLGNSNLTLLPGEKSFARDHWNGRNLHFGVREHGMTAITNGMALAGLRPYAATFLMFADYARPSHRLAALMKLPVVYIYTHDSIGLGEDGPTHQPIEHLASLRAIPGLDVIRPGDANEAVEAWRHVMTRKDGPVAMALSRQNLPVLDRKEMAPAAGLRRGAYVLADALPGRTPEVILMASGSELPLIVQAFEALKKEGVAARLVSFPCWELFERQDAAYVESVLPRAVRARVSVEAASTFGWSRWTGDHGAAIGRDDFGASAPAGVLFKEFGFTVENVLKTAKDVMARAR